ncbi:MAG TPA: hypothetical protein VGB85_06825 [Nannocystis sp.]
MSSSRLSHHFSRRLLPALALLAGLSFGTAAWAHHVPGHGASEGLRTINSLNGSGGRAYSRVLLLNEFVYTSFGLNPGLTDSLSVLGEWAPKPSFSVGVQAPLLMFRGADTKGETRVGYGDTRLQLRFTPHAAKLIHRVLTFGVNLSFPTRTVRFTVDPGPVWGATPYIVFTRTYSTVFWQVLGLATVDARRAGTALDLAVSGQVGGRFLKNKLSPGIGILVDTRVLNFCADPGGGQSFCADSRAGEELRHIGATRATSLATLAYTFVPRASLIASVQAPFTAIRDFSFGWSLGIQGFF